MFWEWRKLWMDITMTYPEQDYRMGEFYAKQNNAVWEATQTAFGHKSERLIEWIRHRQNSLVFANRLAVAGIGKSHHVAQLASCTFASLGIPSIQLDTAHIVHGDSGFIMPGDAILFISKSGSTSETIQAMHCLRNIDPSVTLFLLTCCPISCIHSDICDMANVIDLPKPCGEELNGYSPTTSTLSFIAYLNTLATLCQSFTKHDFAKHHPGGALGTQLHNELRGLPSQDSDLDSGPEEGAMLYGRII